MIFCVYYFRTECPELANFRATGSLLRFPVFNRLLPMILTVWCRRLMKTVQFRFVSKCKIPSSTTGKSSIFKISLVSQHICGFNNKYFLNKYLVLECILTRPAQLITGLRTTAWPQLATAQTRMLETIGSYEIRGRLPGVTTATFLFKRV